MFPTSVLPPYLRLSPSSCCSSSSPPSATSSPLPYSPEQWGHQTAGDESGAARSSATSPMAVAPARRWLGAALPSSGEEGPGQDLQASYLSMKIGGMFQEVIAMSVPDLQVNWLICILFEVLSDCLRCHSSTPF
uniref:Uncharacterized protein n=1 Tax=Oryza meridionalis TaxID=40149 RepID=A0A0E0F764_9ORYZ